MSESDFFSFDKALHQLSLEEDDLKRLISAGEIRAFRDGSQMRLRAEDVQRVAKDLGIGSEIGEADAGEVLEVEEVLFSEAADEDEGMITTQLSEEDTLLDSDLEEVEVADEPEADARAISSARPARATVAAAAESTSPGLVFAAVVTTAIMVYGLAFVVAMGSGQSNGITDAVVNMLASGE